MTFILIAYFDWLLGPQKGKKGKTSLKIFFSETVCFMKLILCIHVPGISLYKKKMFFFFFFSFFFFFFFFCSSQLRTLDAMATFSFYRLIIGKVKICYLEIFEFCYCRNVYLVVLYVSYDFSRNTLF